MMAVATTFIKECMDLTWNIGPWPGIIKSAAFRTSILLCSCKWGRSLCSCQRKGLSRSASHSKRSPVQHSYQIIRCVLLNEEQVVNVVGHQSHSSWDSRFNICLSSSSCATPIAWWPWLHTSSDHQSQVRPMIVSQLCQMAMPSELFVFVFPWHFSLTFAICH